MNLVHKPLLIASLLATLGFGAIAQTAPATPSAPAASTAQAPQGPMGERMGRGDPAQWQQRMAEHHAKHMADLKAKLKLTPAQEGAWTTFSTTMQPPAAPQNWPDRAAWEKLTTPERIDRMQAFHAERDKVMNQHADATKAFYAGLSAEQKKVFDTETLHHGRRGHHRGHGHGWGPQGMGEGMGHHHSR